MIASIAVGIAAVAAFGGLVSKFGVEDRPGFNERRPLA
jgi:hypothetical protein